MSDLKTQQSIKSYPILRSWGFYFLALIGLYLGYKFMVLLDANGVIDSVKNKSWVLTLFVLYFACGIFLNIKIINKLMGENHIEYHQFHNTISEVVSDKISFIIWWVIRYPLFLLKLALINKI
jgi:hypothetical protein